MVYIVRILNKDSLHMFSKILWYEKIRSCLKYQIPLSNTEGNLFFLSTAMGKKMKKISYKIQCISENTGKFLLRDLAALTNNI